MGAIEPRFDFDEWAFWDPDGTDQFFGNLGDLSLSVEP